MMLPRGVPVKEKAEAAGVDLPRMFDRLHSRRFSGYLRFDAARGVGNVVFDRGRLVGAFFEDARTRFRGLDALARIFAQSLAGEAALSVYRLDSALAERVNALLSGRVLASNKEVGRIDFAAILNRLKSARFAGCLRVVAGERVVLILYRDGTPEGFFHDGSAALSATAEVSDSVARLPGAKVDLVAFEVLKEAPDILTSADLSQLWKRTEELVNARRGKDGGGSNRDELLAILRTTAGAHLGQEGISLAEKEFEQVFFLGAPWGKERMIRFYERLARSAGSTAGKTSVQEMIKEMQRRVKTLFE